MLFVIYMVLGYWAVGRTLYRNYAMFGSMTSIVCKKLVVGVVLGWILIPIAIIRAILGR